MIEEYNKEWQWIKNKIPKNEKVCVQYKNKHEVIAIITQDLLTQFKFYQTQNQLKKLLYLGKNKNPNLLESKFLEFSEIEGYLIKNRKGEK